MEMSSCDIQTSPKNKNVQLIDNENSTSQLHQHHITNNINSNNLTNNNVNPANFYNCNEILNSDIIHKSMPTVMKPINKINYDEQKSDVTERNTFLDNLELDVKEAIETLLSKIVSNSLNTTYDLHTNENGSNIDNSLPANNIPNNNASNNRIEEEIILIERSPTKSFNTTDAVNRNQPQIKIDPNSVSTIEKDLKPIVNVHATTTTMTTATAVRSSIIEIDRDSGVEQLNVIVSESSLIEEDELDDPREDKEKDIVTLRNLEITPPPQQTAALESDQLDARGKSEDQDKDEVSPAKSRKRTLTPEVTEDETKEEEGGRSKRRRTQTTLFQAGDVKSEELNITTPMTKKRSSRAHSTSSSRASLSSTKSTKAQSPEAKIPAAAIQQTNDLQDVIFYKKNEYLAIRNEENSYYLCQLAENVRVQRPLIKVKWLDTDDGGKTYFLTQHFDTVPQKSIIMPVLLNRPNKGEKRRQVFVLDDQDRENIMDRLNKSLSAQYGNNISQEVTTEES